MRDRRALLRGLTPSYARQVALAGAARRRARPALDLLVALRLLLGLVGGALAVERGPAAA